MCLKKILEHAFSTQIREYEHHTSDYVNLFGTISGIMCITLGLSMSLFSSTVAAFMPFCILGLTWVFFGAMVLAGVFFYKSGKKRQGAIVLLSSGLMSIPFGAGFFLGSVLAVFAGGLAIKDIYHESAKMPRHEARQITSHPLPPKVPSVSQETVKHKPEIANIRDDARDERAAIQETAKHNPAIKSRHSAQTPKKSHPLRSKVPSASARTVKHKSPIKSRKSTRTPKTSHPLPSKVPSASRRTAKHNPPIKSRKSTRTPKTSHPLPSKVPSASARTAKRTPAKKSRKSTRTPDKRKRRK